MARKINLKLSYEWNEDFRERLKKIDQSLKKLNNFESTMDAWNEMWRVYCEGRQGLAKPAKTNNLYKIATSLPVNEENEENYKRPLYYDGFYHFLDYLLQTLPKHFPDNYTREWFIDFQRLADKDASTEDFELVNKYLPPILGNQPRPTHFVSPSQNVLISIKDSLNDDDSILLLVNGEEGVGKTAVVTEALYQLFLNVSRKFIVKKFYYLDGHEHEAETLQEAIAKFSPIGEDDIEKRFGRVIKDRRNILFLDHISSKQFEAFCDLLTDNGATRRIRCKIIITSREKFDASLQNRLRTTNNVRQVEIPPLSPENAKRLFQLHCPENLPESQLNQLLIVTENIPEAIIKVTEEIKLFRKVLSFTDPKHEMIPSRDKLIKGLANEDKELLEAARFLAYSPIDKAILISAVANRRWELKEAKDAFNRLERLGYFIQIGSKQKYIVKEQIYYARVPSLRNEPPLNISNYLTNHYLDIAELRLQTDYRHILKIFEWLKTRGNPDRLLELTVKMCDFLYRQGEWHACSRMITTVFRTFEDSNLLIKEKRQESYLLGYLGQLRIGYGDYQRAEVNLKNAIEIAKDADNALLLSHSFNLGRLYFRQGVLDEAAKQFKFLLEKLNNSEPEHRLLKIKCLNNLASVDLEKDRIDEALTKYGEALKETNREFPLERVRLLNNIGVLYLRKQPERKENLDSAIKYFEEANQVFEKGTLDTELKGEILFNLGVAYREKSSPEDGDALLWKAFELFDQLGAKEKAGIVLSYLVEKSS